MVLRYLNYLYAVYELDDSVNPHVCQQCYEELEAESEQSKADDSVNPHVCQQCYEELEAESEQSKADDSVNPYE
tara:strand:+ start:267 stop:488 length:222 start_codon:yes stop_codon:yes gene_type:complete